MKSRICQNCNQEYQNKRYDNRSKFCSRSCSATFNNKIKPKRVKKIRYCKCCNSLLTNKKFRMICDTCFSSKKYMTFIQLERERCGSLTVYDVKCLTKTNKRPWTDKIRSYARSWFSTINKSCKKCGYSKHVEVCHIIPISSFSDTSLVKDINAESNIIFLCPNCHWEHDNL